MKTLFQKFKKREGSATIEAVVAFVGFVFTIFTILNIVNFCRAQVLVSNAVDTVAKELTQYGYFYKMSGLQKFSDDMSKNAGVGEDKLNEVIGSVDTLYKSLDSSVNNSVSRGTEITNAIEGGGIDMNTFKTALDGCQADAANIESSIALVSANIDNIMTNPVAYLKSLAAVAGSESLNLAKSRLIAAPLAKAFFAKHFGSNKAEADATLKDLGVIDGLDGIDFKYSTMFHSSSPNDVHIVAFYKIQVIQLFRFAELNATIRKDAHAMAWLGGDDVLVQVKPQQTTNESESSSSIWDEGDFTRGKKIVEEEKKNLAYTLNEYIHGFDEADNRFIQIRTLNTYEESYSGADGKENIKKQLVNEFSQMHQKAEDEFVVTASDGSTKTVKSDESTRKYKIILVVPDDADMNMVKEAKEAFIKDRKDLGYDVDVEIKTGYGSPSGSGG